MSNYTCPKCNKIFKKEKVSVACAVLHQEGDCCHYGQTELKTISKNNNTNQDIIRTIVDTLWTFHNNRLKDSSIVEMKPYIQPILDEVIPKSKLLEVLDKHMSIQRGDYYQDLTDLSRLLKQRSEDIKKELEL